MSNIVDDLLEQVSVEISLSENKRIVVSCIYRSPGTNIDNFNEFFERIFNHMNEKKL